MQQQNHSVAEKSAPMGLRERNRQETQLRIEDTATAMFLERGIDDVTLEEICSEAGISRRTFFNYFASKDQLIGGTVDHESDDEIFDTLRQLPEDASSPFVVRAVEIIGAEHLARHQRNVDNSIDPELSEDINRRRAELIKSSPQLMLARMKAFEVFRGQLRSSISDNLSTHPGNRVLNHLTLMEETLLIVNLIATTLWSGMILVNEAGDGQLDGETLTTTVRSVARLTAELDTLDFRN